MDKLKTLIEAVNEINSNVWGFTLILFGGFLVLRHADNVGTGIIGGGLSLLNTSAIKKTVESNFNSTVNNK